MSESPDPKKLSEVELLRFCKLEAEISNCLQGLRLLNYEAQDENRRHAAKLETLFAQEKHLKALLSKTQASYNMLLVEIATKYEISSPQNIIIDDETGVIRDSKE